jgi:uncharacterized membrane protein YraQ (UPF0718 family)
VDWLLRALSMAFAVGWQILWPFILGFFLSAVVEAVVSHQQMSVLLPNDRPRSVIRALVLGAASSSCSYAAVALARSLYRRGANFTAAMAFEMASTNLVLRTLGELLFAALGLIPQQRNALVAEASVSWDYTTWLNIAFLALAAYLIWRFGGVPMLKMMNSPAATLR